MITFQHLPLLDHCTLFAAPAVGEAPTVALGVDEAIDFFAAHAHAGDHALHVAVPVSDLRAPVRVEPVEVSGRLHSERLCWRVTRRVCALCRISDLLDANPKAGASSPAAAAGLDRTRLGRLANAHVVADGFDARDVAGDGNSLAPGLS